MALYEFLISKKLYYDNKIIKIIENKLKCTRKFFLLRGPAGTGKTELATAIAQYLNAKIVFYQCTYGTGEDELLYKYVPSEDTKSGIKLTLGPLPLALISSQEQKTVLILDEFDKTRPSTDALLLDFLQNCRLSVYIDERQQVITGNPENLVVFLTSNDIREFSEPLLRRLTVIQLSHLPATKVYELLKQRFPENIALLLVQIYDDTIKAELRKPATLQELYELGEFLEKEQSIDLNELIKVFIIKYDDDYQRYIDYIKNREPYSFVREDREDEDISEYYETMEDVVIEEEEKEEERKSVSEILSKLKVKRTETTEMNIEEVKREQEVTAKIEDNDREGYTKIIKALKPEPSNDPTRFGKFQLVFDEKEYIISKEPLKFNEIIEIIRNNIEGEYYFEDKIQCINEIFSNLIDLADKIRYYTKNRIVVEKENYDAKLILDVQKIDEDGLINTINIRGYLKYDGRESSASMLEEIIKHKDSIEARIVDTIKAILISGETDKINMLPLKQEVKIDEAIYREDNNLKTLKAVVKNARELRKVGISVKFTTNTVGYDCYIVVHSNKEIEVGIGYNFAKIVGSPVYADITDKKVDEIIEKIEKSIKNKN